MGFLHAVHLGSQVRFLVLEVCLQLRELLVLLQDGLVPLLQKALQRQHLLLQLTDEDKIVRSPTIC